MNRAGFKLVASAFALAFSVNSQAFVITSDIAFETTFIKDYLLISKSSEGVDTAISTGSSQTKLGHVSQLAASAPAIPSGLPSPVTTDPTFDGDAAILQSNGGFNYTSGMEVYGSVDKGVVCAQTAGDCDQGTSSDTDFDDDDGNGLQGQTVGRGIEQFSTSDLNSFTTEVNAARDVLLDLASRDGSGGEQGETIDLGAGTISSDLTITLDEPGLNLFFFEATSDISVESNLIFEGAAGATPGDRQAIVFIQDNRNFLTSNGNILVDDDNLGLMDVLIVSLRQDNASHFSFSNSNINGVAFWDMWRDVGATSDPGEVVWNNVSGCTQILGDKINLSSDNYLSNCGFRGLTVDVSEPEHIVFFSMMLFVVGWYGRRKSFNV